MKLIFTIARRYLFSRKSSNAINIITWVSIIGIGVGSAAIILVLSVFNGLTGFIEGLFAAIDPDIKIVAAEGKTFTYRDSIFNQIDGHPDIAAVTRTLDGRVWVQYGDNQTIATLKGIEPDFVFVNPLDTFVYEGDFSFATRNGISQGLFGAVVAARLNADLTDEIRPISISYIPQESNFLNPETSVNTDFVFPVGYFSIQKEYDEKYVIADLGFVQSLFEADSQLSAYEIRLNDIDQADRVKPQLQAMLGPEYEVLTWYEQHSSLYRLMKNEKYISFLILVLMLAIAAVNIVGSLYMIVWEKNRDIAVLKSMGATDQMIQRIFQATGLLVGGLGALVGLTIALFTGLGQKYLSLLKLQGGESFRVKAFPIEMIFNDFFLVVITVIILSWLASWYPARRAAKVKVVDGIHG
ncbi:MAG: FtsX-like permease family protein [Bacteroidota bacterium]